jgi:hypothetical protein
MKVYGYCLQCKKKMPFAKAEVEKMSNGSYRVVGYDQYGHKMSKFISVDDLSKMKGAGLLGSITGMDFGPLSRIPLLNMLF